MDSQSSFVTGSPETFPIARLDMLESHDLTKRFGAMSALDCVNIAIRPGKITVLVGPSGAGKTTLVRALSLIDPPTSGRVVIDGTSYVFPPERGPKALMPWPKVTVVFQQLFLWPHLTLRENVLLPLRHHGMDEGVLDEVAQLFKMEAFLSRYPNEVSLGQRQRAALARAVVLQPSYILLDEITSALDVEQTATILKYLLTLRDRGIGLLVVTHFLGFARRLLARREGDQIAFIDGGRILEAGDIDLLDKPQTDRLKRFLSAVEPVT